MSVANEPVLHPTCGDPGRPHPRCGSPRSRDPRREIPATAWRPGPAETGGEPAIVVASPASCAYEHGRGHDGIAGVTMLGRPTTSVATARQGSHDRCPLGGVPRRGPVSCGAVRRVIGPGITGDVVARVAELVFATSTAVGASMAGHTTSGVRRSAHEQHVERLIKAARPGPRSTSSTSWPTSWVDARRNLAAVILPEGQPIHPPSLGSRHPRRAQRPRVDPPDHCDPPRPDLHRQREAVLVLGRHGCNVGPAALDRCRRRRPTSPAGTSLAPTTHSPWTPTPGWPSWSSARTPSARRPARRCSSHWPDCGRRRGRLVRHPFGPGCSTKARRTWQGPQRPRQTVRYRMDSSASSSRPPHRPRPHPRDRRRHRHPPPVHHGRGR